MKLRFGVTNCDKHKKRQETKKNYGDIEALADARRALKKHSLAKKP